jgi:acetyl esterase
MPLDPQAKAVIDQLAQAQLPDFTTLQPATLRNLYEMAFAAGESEPVAHVEERTLPGPAGGIPVRVYRPRISGLLPALVYFHGGGWVVCSLDTHDNVCRALANRAGCAVVSVDYRLAPEHRYPAAPEDCYAAATWVAERGASLGVDAARIAVGGDSAGGNLAAVVALLAREREAPRLAAQLLVYPVTNNDFDNISYKENAEGYLLTRSMMQWFFGHYLEDPADASLPTVSPLRAERLDGLPPALLVTAGYDPLRDEGDAYAERLRQAGVPTRHLRYDGMFHGFFSMFEQIETGRDAIEAAALFLRESFAPR